MFSSLKLEGHLGHLFPEPEITGVAPITPANGYVAEDGVTFYVAEDGATYYVQEH